MSNFDSPSDIVADVLFRADEPPDSADFLTPVRRAFVRAAHDFNNRHPWPHLRAYPPGAFVTVAPVTTTLTVAAGESVVGTLGAAQATSLVGRKILPTGSNWFARITAHTAATDQVTLDAVPDALAGTTIVIVKDEYQLAADLGLFLDGIWTEDGFYIELKSEEFVRKEFSDLPTPAWPPTCFARLNQRMIRLSHFPSAAKRAEYPYIMAPDDLDATSTTELIVPHNWRWLLSDATLYFAFEMKSDKRIGGAKQSYEKGIEDYITYARRMMMGIGSQPGSGQRGPYE